MPNEITKPNEIAKTLYFIRSNWYNNFGLLATTILAVVLLRFIFGSYLEKYQFWYFPYLLLPVAIFLCWTYSRSCYPKNKKNKAGIVIAIHTESERDEIQIKNDFIKETKNLILSRSLDSIFQVLVLNNYKSQKIETPQQALEITNKTKSHFVIWGNFKKRQHQGRSICVLNLQSLVRHRPIKNLRARTQFAKEFNQIFPTKIRFPQDQELQGFELTTSVIHEAVMYLIGIAALTSGDLLLSSKLHNDLYETIRNETLVDKIEQLKIIKQRLPKLLAQEYTLAARFYYVSKRNKDMNKVKEYSQKAIQYNPQVCNAHLSLAICFFFEKNLPLALREIKKAKKILPRDGAVRYSEAFLYFYDRNFSKAEIAYKKALKTSTPSPTILEVELFITDVLEREPDKTYLHYPLALINYRVKEDYTLATEYFEKFVDSCEDDPDLADQIRKARIFLRELQSKKQSEQKKKPSTIKALASL